MQNWLKRSHADGLSLIPESAYQELRVEHSILFKRLIVLNNPEDIKFVCGTKNKHFSLSNLHLRMLTPSLGEGLVVAQGHKWSLQRRLAFSLMPKKHGSNALEYMTNRIDISTASWTESEQAIGIESLITDLVGLSIDLISASIFKHYEPVSHQTIITIINQHRANIEKIDIFDALGLPASFVSPRMARAKKLGHAIDDEINETINRARRNQILNNLKNPDLVLRRDFVLSLITGFESVATTSLWALIFLADRPDLQAQILAHNEDTELCPERPPISGNMLDMVIAETMRMFPPLPFIFRQCKEPTANAGGNFKKGDLILISPWLVHRHQKLWDQPDVFKPTRFSDLKSWPQHYIPFGVGARRCVGRGIGFNLIKQIILRTLLKNKVVNLSDSPPMFRAGVSLRPSYKAQLLFSKR